MTEPDNHTLRLLQKIRAKLDRRDSKRDAHAMRFDRLDEVVETSAGYVTFAVGKSGENRADIDVPSAEVKALKARVDALESRTRPA